MPNGYMKPSDTTLKQSRTTSAVVSKSNSFCIKDHSDNIIYEIRVATNESNLGLTQLNVNRMHLRYSLSSNIFIGNTTSDQLECQHMTKLYRRLA